MPNTTRRTATRKMPKVKPTKTKKVKKKRTGSSKTATAALNTYKSVKHKIGLDADGKERRVERRTNRRLVKDEIALRKREDAANEVQDIPVIKRMQVISDNAAPIKRITKGDAITEDLKYPINPLTGKIDYSGAVDSELLGREKTSEDLEIYADKKPKKNNTLLYILLIALVAFAVYKMTAKK